MRSIKYIAVHCTATAQGATITGIKKYWKEQLGWRMPGYHFIVPADGKAVELLNIERVSNGVAGYNKQTINICYIGGVDGQNKPIDNRTPAQKQTLLTLISGFKKQFPNAMVQGHRDFPNVKKACPCFDAKKEYNTI